MLTKNIIFSTLSLLLFITQSNGQNINFYDFDSLGYYNFPNQNSFLYQSKNPSTHFNLSNLDWQGFESNDDFNLNFDYLKDYKFKSYNMREFYIFHRLNSTPALLRDNYPLPPYVDNQKIEIIKMKK